MNKDKRNNIQLLGTLNNADESGIIANANQVYDANEDKSTQDVSKEHKERIETLETKESSMQTTLENITKTGEASAASNVTYNHNDSKLDATNIQQAVDEISTKTVFDISAYHATGGTLATYADLSAALDSNNGGGVPQSLQKGGMSIKFVQSSDNKYIQARCMAQNFTTDVTQWAIADEGVYVENPEFAKVVLDNENKILEAVRIDGTKLLPAGVEINEKIDFEGNETTIIESPEFVEVKLDSAGHIFWGIQKDGNVFFGAGVPQQIIDYVEEKLADLSLDEYEDIVAFLNGLEEGDKTLQTLLNEKVDKEEGKSLIDAEYASSQSAIENPEFLDVTLDAEDKVLEGIKEDGTKVIGGDLNVGGSANLDGDLRVLGNMEVSGVSYKVIESPEYLAAWADAEDKVIFGFKTDGKTYVGDADFLNEIKNNQEAINEIKSYLANFDNLDIDALSSITAIENPEYIDVKVDSEDKILEGITIEGKKQFNIPVDNKEGIEIGGTSLKSFSNPEWLNVITDSEDKILEGIHADGIKKINIPVDNGAAIIETTDNPEFLEAKIDAEGKLIEGINKNGEKIFGVIPPQIKQYIDENIPVGGSGIQSIEYEDATGDMYATYDDESGVTDVSMDSNGDIYVEYETGV